jgi:hypothetical protein
MHAAARQMAVMSAAFQFQWVKGNSHASNRCLFFILQLLSRIWKNKPSTHDYILLKRAKKDAAK